MLAERVQLDSITANELGDPEALLRPLVPTAKRKGPDAMAGWLDVPQLGETCSGQGSCCRALAVVCAWLCAVKAYMGTAAALAMRTTREAVACKGLFR